MIDLRTLIPYDIETILASAKKTGRVVIVHEAPKACGLGGELVALINERAFLHLEAPPKPVTRYDTPFPCTLKMEYLSISSHLTDDRRDREVFRMARFEFKLLENPDRLFLEMT